MNAAELSLIKLPSTWSFNPETIRLMVRDFAKRAGSDGESLAKEMERQLCDEDGQCLDAKTYIRFSKWNHTSMKYKRAEHVAQAISLMVYGHIIERHPSTLWNYRWVAARTPAVEQPPVEQSRADEVQAAS